ncbi:YSIRK-type signal peptide-containing protein [Gemella taiwanensis]
MSNKKKYSIRKVSVGTASVLIGIAAGSLGTAYAQEETNNVVISSEVSHKVTEEHINKPILEEPNRVVSSPEAAPKSIGEEVPQSEGELHRENRDANPILENKIDWNLIKEKEYLKYSLENIIDAKEKDRLTSSLWSAKTNNDIIRIRKEYEEIKKSEEKQRELENRVNSLKTINNLYMSSDKTAEFAKEVSSAKTDKELNEIVNKYKLEALKKELTDNYYYLNIAKEEIDSANSVAELNNLKDKYRLSTLKEELVSLLKRESSTRHDENTGREVPLLSKDRIEVLLKEIESLKSEEKASELRKRVEAEQQMVYKRESVISRVKGYLTDLADEQLKPFVNELEKYTTEADFNKVQDKIEAEDKKLREERIKKEQANILDVLNTKAKLNDYEKEKLKQEMVELYKEEYEEKPKREHERPTNYYGDPLFIKYNRVGKSYSESRLLENIERIELLKNNIDLSEKTRKIYIDIILQNKNHRNTDILIEFESLIGKINKSNLIVNDKEYLIARIKNYMKYFVNPNYSDKSSFLVEQKSTFEKLKKVEDSTFLPKELKEKLRENLLNENLESISEENIEHLNKFYRLENQLLKNTTIPNNVLGVLLKDHLEKVEKEEILPILKDLLKTRELLLRSRAFSSDSKLTQLTTKVESLEKLYSYTRIPEYKLITFRDEILDANSSVIVRSTLATARAVEETLEILGFNGNYPKVKDRLENNLRNENPKEEKVTDDKKENKEVTKETDKKETPKGNKVSENKNEPVKEAKKETPKEQALPKDKKATPGRETSKVTPSKQEATNDKKQETSTNTAKVENHVLLAKLSGRDVAVLFDKDKIKADNVFVGSINDENLNKTIIEKLGSEYKVVEVFEIHFEKDGKKLDSDAERTVKMSVVKNDNAELEVYHIAENNELEKVESSFSEGAVKFKINHFSKFTILERIRVGAKDLESRVQIVTPVKAEHKPEVKKEESDNSDNTNSDKKEGTNNKETEKLPQTGLETTKSLGIVLLALGAAITIRKKQKQ